VRGDGAVAADSSCTSPRPDSQQACNVQSCTNAACNPALIFPIALGALTPTTGPAPLTVTFDVFAGSTFVWDVIDFGDGTTSQGIPLKFVFFVSADGHTSGSYACVNHTYTRAGTFSAGRSLIGGDPAYYPKHEVTVVAQ
jgi:hypothetical protein